MLSHIVAASENNIIGVKNGLPWHLTNDFKYFKNKTWAMPVIMGSSTYESMKKDLPGRINIVVTRRKDWKPENLRAVVFVQRPDTHFIIGAASIPLAH